MPEDTKIRPASLPVVSTKIRGNRFIDLGGKVFGRLTVLSDTDEVVNRRSMWLCVCVCGQTTRVRSTHLTHNKIISCGCYAKETAKLRARSPDSPAVRHTHGLSGTRVYPVYRAMVDRCKPNAGHPAYGERGIHVCERWLGPGGFERFIEDMGMPSDDDSIERKDVNGNYEPGNCEWIPRSWQARNKRNTIRVDWLGETLTLMALSKKIGMRYKTLHKRYVMFGWSLEESVKRPLKAGMPKKNKGN